MVSPPAGCPVVVHQLGDGRWKVRFPDGLTVVTVDECQTALALVPAGVEFQVIPQPLPES